MMKEEVKFTDKTLEQNITEKRKCNLDRAFDLAAQVKQITRNLLIDLLHHNDNQIRILENWNGKFGLCLVGKDYLYFYFETIIYEGNNDRLIFTGLNEKGENKKIDEYDLPENGLLYLCHYMINENYYA